MQTEKGLLRHISFTFFQKEKHFTKHFPWLQHSKIKIYDFLNQLLQLLACFTIESHLRNINRITTTGDSISIERNIMKSPYSNPSKRGWLSNTYVSNWRRSSTQHWKNTNNDGNIPWATPWFRHAGVQIAWCVEVAC